ncbi:expressed unknown protein [Seminavis robusta]|uniref:Methyltransferase domain-containing protein n=1 Tax=Seminavis robusta TaxID=568900 RepID=A0A9N8DQL7_9STRA|nr:expressed unknown protein [Seminavis robusta]|eukprot:Sro216_g089450.1 n/a (270) ;mRNA; f:59995-60804
MDDGQATAPSDRDNDAPDNIPKKKTGPHGARNQHRHIHFAKWLQQRFPMSFQESHLKKQDDAMRHILDIAGGKGELTARLSMCLQQRVVMVDPRQADIANCFDTQVLPRLPNKWQKRIEDQRADNPDFVRQKVEERVRQLVTTFDDRTLVEDAEIQEAVQNATLLIGLHADGATEAIVDAALQYQKPFVVVPCCVFPSFFPDRTVVMEPDGPSIHVRTHEQFCQFLLQKHPGFRMEILPFEGRNVAILWDGVSQHLSQPRNVPVADGNL